MKKKHLLAPATILLFGFILLGASSFLLIENPDTEEALLEIGPELESAQIEKAFQNLPEETPLPNSLKIPIFIYHSVRPHIKNEPKKQDDFDITPELLEREIVYLQNNGYTTITLDELANDLENGKLSPATKPVILTFDDGWRNQYKYAFPILKKYHATGVFYIYTNPIGKKHFLTWDQIKEMDKAGMTIADHTLSHPYFKNTPLDEIKKEVTESKAIIERELGKPVLHFASPFGYTNPQIMAIVKEAGYKTARTTYKGIYHTKDDLLKLRGILADDNFNDFVAVLQK